MVVDRLYYLLQVAYYDVFIDLLFDLKPCINPQYIFQNAYVAKDVNLREYDAQVSRNLLKMIK